MASHLPFITLSLFVLLSLCTPSHSAVTCASQKLPQNRSFTNCTDLPTLSATLHFTFNASNRTLAVAYSAAPPSSSGWVAWGLNLAGGGMIGTEALLAFTQNGALAVHRYNLTAYKGIDEVKAFTFDSWDVSAEQGDAATIIIFATVKIPDTAGNVTHVWQVGPVSSGKPSIHGTKPENLQSKAVLPVALGPAAGPGPGPASGSGNATAPASGGKSGARERFGLGMGFYFGLVLAFMMGYFYLYLYDVVFEFGEGGWWNPQLVIKICQDIGMMYDDNIAISFW
ncbi:Auxin-induced in root cultures protein 12, partial [Mucuna pruriens]